MIKTHWGCDARPYAQGYWIACKEEIDMDEDCQPLFPFSDQQKEINCPECLEYFIKTERELLKYEEDNGSEELDTFRKTWLEEAEGE